MPRFTGYVDGVYNHEVVGWALDQSDLSTPIVVTISVNGVPLTRALACHHRADVASAFQSSGLHGFRVLLPDKGSAYGAEVSMACEDGQILANSTSPQWCEMQTRSRERWNRPCLLFMHIQKTAGTAFRDAILPNYCAAETALTYPNPPGVPREQFKLMPVEQRRSLRCVIGHFEFGIHEELDQPFEYATIVRDPVQRAISHYDHLCWARSPLLLSREGDLLALDAALESRAAVELDNLLTRYFCGNDGLGLGYFVDKEWYERAVANLHRFRFIGHQEQSNAALADLSRLYGWSQGTLKKANVLNESRMEVNTRTLAMIADYNRYDVMLYRKIKAAS